MDLSFVYYLLTFIFGLFVGSFLNLVSDRIIKEEKIINDRSRCDHCKTILKPKNLIPVLSYIFQKGKCAECKTRLSLYYPVSEILTGLLFLYAAYLSGIFSSGSLNLSAHAGIAWSRYIGFAFFLAVFCFYIVMLLTDSKYFIIPDKVVYSAIAFVFLFLLLSSVVDLYSLHQKLKADDFGKYLLQVGYFRQQLSVSVRTFGMTLLTSLGIAFFFLSLVVLTKGRGMGGGDIKLGLLIGLVNGFPVNILAVFFGFFLGAVYSVLLILMRKTTIKDTIAFGPFLILGSLVCLLYGNTLLNWYIYLF